LWRIERWPVDEWSWEGFPVPSYRFDPASGAFRTRYAGQTFAGAARERYAEKNRYIWREHGEHFVTRLVATRPLRIVDLRTEANLDALGVDDRISTGREDKVWTACHDLVDAMRRWSPDLDGLVYRSRTTPATSTNVAFFSLEGLAATSTLLRDCGAELHDLVLTHGFTVAFEY
jgi:hypothetical protein